MDKKHYKAGLGIAIIVVTALLAGCDSGSFGSEVGDSVNSAPIAEVQILNDNGRNEFRTGAEVILSGKASEDPDGPILDYSWNHVPSGGQAPITLIERNANTVSFTVPNLADGTQLSFRLTVEDSSGTSSSSTATIIVREALDADRFLSLKVQAQIADPNVFDISPVLAQEIMGGDASYTIDVDAFLIYPETASSVDCRAISGVAPTDTEVTSGSLVADSQCLVGLQRNLTGSGGIAGSWPVGVTPGAGVPNPRHTLRVPAVDADDLNQIAIDAGRREDLLELYNVVGAYMALRVRINPAVAANLASGEVSAGGNSVPISGSATEFWVVADDILAALPNTESALTAQDYYSRVDPFDERLSLNRWICVAGFGDDAACASVLAEDPNAPGFVPSVVVPLKAAAEAGTNSGTDIFAHATYLNNYDLGFGRDMYTRIDTQTGYVYTFVNNYATLEGAIRKTDPIVSVVMEFSPRQISRGVFDGAAEPFVKFYTYAPDGTGDMLLVTSMNFDGRGELPTPGNCIACHGGNDAGDPANVSPSGNVAATFLPWDPDSLLFLDDDPAITGAPVFLDGTTVLGDLQALATAQGRSLDRNSQLTQLKKMNEAALATYTHPQISDPTMTSSALALLDVFYDGTGFNADFDPMNFDVSLNGSFVPRQVPDGWDETGAAAPPAGSAAFYLNAYAQHCRMCHTNITDPGLRFDSYAEFAGIAQNNFPVQLGSVFNRGVMPGARLTSDRFWVDDGSGTSPGAQMAAYLLDVDPATTTLPSPPSAQAVIDINPDPLVAPIDLGTLVQLDGSESLFVESYQWTVTRDLQPVAVTGATTARPSFRADVPGDYVVQLDINGGADTTSEVFTVVNLPPVATDDPNFDLNLTPCFTQPATCRTFNSSPESILTNDDDPDGNNADLSLALLTGTGNDPQSGTVALSATVPGEFVYTYDAMGDIINPPASDSFAYRITDPFGGFDDGRVTINISAANDQVDPTTPTNLVASEASTIGAASVFQVRLTWSASSDAETGVRGYNVYPVVAGVFGTPIFRTVAEYEAENPDGYVVSGLNDNTPYTFAVTAVDNNGNESDTGSAPQDSQTTNVSYRLSVNQTWANFTCVGCHSTTTPLGGLRLDGPANITIAQVYACIRGDVVNCPVMAGTSMRDRADPATSPIEQALILCVPAETTPCNVTRVTHSGNPYFDLVNGPQSDIDAYNLIRLWLQQGTLNN